MLLHDMFIELFLSQLGLTLFTFIVARFTFLTVYLVSKLKVVFQVFNEQTVGMC